MDANTISIPEWMQRTYPPPDQPKKATVWKWIRNGEIQPPPVRIGRDYRIDPQAKRDRSPLCA